MIITSPIFTHHSLNFCGRGLPLIISKKNSKIKPPSRRGRGIKLKSPNWTDRVAIPVKNAIIPNLAVSSAKPAIAKGPPKVLTEIAPVIIPQIAFIVKTERNQVFSIAFFNAPSIPSLTVTVSILGDIPMRYLFPTFLGITVTVNIFHSFPRLVLMVYFHRSAS